MLSTLLKATSGYGDVSGYDISRNKDNIRRSIRVVFQEPEVSYEFGKDRANEERMDYLEFIARVTSHIPDKGQVMVRYYGLYSNARRGKMRKAQQAANPFLIIEQEEPFVPSKGWAEIRRKVYEVDPLICPSCGGQMKIIAFIEDHKVIDRIMGYLKLRFVAERPPPPQVAQHELLMAAEERGEYFYLYLHFLASYLTNLRFAILRILL